MTQLIVLYETNVLSLISQRLNNYYQIQTKYYNITTVHNAFLMCTVWATKHTLGRPTCPHASPTCRRALGPCGVAVPLLS